MDTSRAGLKEVIQEESESGAYVLDDDEHDDDDEDHDEDDDGQERRDTASSCGHGESGLRSPYLPYGP